MNLRFPLLLLAAGLPGCATPPAPAPADAPVPAVLADCSGGPHCVSSLAADSGHLIAAFKLKVPAETAWPAIVAAVKASERTHIVQSTARYLHAEVISPWGVYTDDLELMLGDDGRVEVRSSSRIGYYDFDVNRKRVEALRQKLIGDGAISP